MGLKNTTMFDIMEILFTLLVILSVAKPGLSSTTKTFNVLHYGAVGDKITDDSPAFEKAWKDVCQSKSDISQLVVPAGKTFLLKPITFTGPCKSTYTYIQVLGNIVAPKTKSEYSGHHTNTWLGFSNINGLIIKGKGIIDGRGSAWWQQPCLGNPSPGTKCRPPSALTLNRCYRFQIKGLTHINPARSHITLTSCKHGTLSNLRLIAPGTSPNTDGIDISGSRNIQVLHSFIATGDDCIAISSGSSKIKISGITCGPGHGISIGSLGTAGKTDTVEDVHVKNCTITETLTGVRIKTWQGGAGFARRISFEDIKFVRANSPIIIDQFYCPNRIDCQNKTEAVKVSDVTFKRIVGTSLMEEAINLSCDQNIGCSNIVLDDIDITSAIPGKEVFSFCHNAHGKAINTKPAVNCLLK
ncbi:PREDICTED: probable polygalacturonase At3g15720 [Lupinus angustifolius]|uniref:probable polygalacturonase At3g15720 n=1 Tax=Lupinus angustifolius TaxID=3871 RepID=UPI00092F3E7A|nr:PREDICTED: probable polygalacturonase At3g15720 [Lupinus angustifolius]